MRLLHWNCQGLRNPLTVRHLQEIQVRFSPEGTRGGLAILWDFHVVLTVTNPSFYQSDVYIQEGQNNLCVTYVYGYPERSLRNAMWRNMQDRAVLYQATARVVFGDFNDIQSNEEKEGGPMRSEATFAVFRDMIEANGLQDIRVVGGFFTWIGVRHDHTIRSRIDRDMANNQWFDLYPRSYVQLLDWRGSDHRPLLLVTGDTKWKGKKLFRYDNRWKSNPQVKDLIKYTWEDQCIYLPPHSFSQAIIHCRDALAKWKRKQQLNSKKKILQLQHRLNSAEEEEYWRTRSGIQWLKTGDRNTKYFQEKVKQRRAANRITILEDDGGNIYQDEKELQQQIEQYFTSLYSSRDALPNVDQILQGIPQLVTSNMNRDLIRPVTLDEIRVALFNINPDKAPGPDGMSSGFFRHHWDILKDSIYDYVSLFFQEGYLDPEMNQTSICLIPKKESPTHLKDFRPISLANVTYKIISKVLANRLKPWLKNIIPESQTTFVPGRLITDNVLIAHGLLHSLSTRRLKYHYMAIKLDITKAFDKVEWSFVGKVMQRMGFHPQWSSWIMKCITTVSYLVLLNGEPTRRIFPQRDDSLLFLKANKKEAAAVQELLRHYAAASRQEVNFHKSAIMFSKGTSQWDVKKLEQMFNPADVNLIIKIRPSEEQEPLFKAVWRLNAPPKIKMFWWRLVHDRLPVATQMQKRGIHLDTT